MQSTTSFLFEMFLRNPFVIVYLIAIYLSSSKLMEKSEQAAKLVIAGCIVNILVSYGSQYLFQFIMESDLTDSYGREKVMMVYSLTSMILHSIGFFLILAAAFVDRGEGMNKHDPYANQSVFS